MEYDVIAIGELLIDFVENGKSVDGNPMMVASPGGAPCNVLAMLAKLNKKTAFIGKVGNDGFGRMLKEKIEEAGIDSSNLLFDESVHTTLAIVTKDKDGDRSFAFYRKPGADINLRISELNKELFKKSRIFHFGTLSFTDDPVRETTKQALLLARTNNLLISYDPNLREPLWDDLNTAHFYTDFGLKYTDILKISDNEIEWFCGTKDYDAALNDLVTKYPNLKLIVLTLGKGGSIALHNGIKVFHKAYLNDGIAETTGCGDTFMGSVLNYVLEHGLTLNEAQLIEMLRFASAAASIVSSRIGALMVMPDYQEIMDYLNNK